MHVPNRFACLFRPGITVRFVAAAFLLPAAAPAQPVIDSFEMGTVHLSIDGTTVTQSQAVSAPSHCIAPMRKITFTSNVLGVGPSTLDVNAFTTADDQLEIFFAWNGGECLLEYVPTAPVDLTDGFANDRVEVRFSTATVNGVFELRLWDDQGGFSADSVVTSVSSGYPTFWLDPFHGTVNPRRVTKVQLSIRKSNQSVYDIREIVCARAASNPIEFDASGLVAIGPPFPVSPEIFQVSDNNGPVEEMAMTLASVQTVGGGQLGMIVQSDDGGGDVGMFGENAQLTAMWDGAGTWQDCGFEIPVDVSAISGIQPEPFLPMLPTITQTPTGFLLQFDVWYEDPGGSIVSTSRRWMSFDVPGPQGLMLMSPSVMPPAGMRAARASGYSGFVLSFDAVEAGVGVDPGEPLLEAMVIGDCVAGAPTGAPAVTGTPAGVAALSARPSVTRSGTRLRLATPSRMDGSIELFDVTGRLVRRLGLPAGASSVAWDGRGRSGGSVPAGVYFARIAGAKAGGTARVVVVR